MSVHQFLTPIPDNRSLILNSLMGISCKNLQPEEPDSWTSEQVISKLWSGNLECVETLNYNFPQKITLTEGLLPMYCETL